MTVTVMNVRGIDRPRCEAVALYPPTSTAGTQCVRPAGHEGEHEGYVEARVSLRWTEAAPQGTGHCERCGHTPLQHRENHGCKFWDCSCGELAMTSAPQGTDEAGR